MRKTRRIIPYALLSGLLVSCVTDHKLARVRISQPQMKEAVADTGFRLPRQITWTDDKGKEHIVTEATKDSVTGEYITQMELSEITVVAKSKQVAERNGKINLDFIVTVPGELISNKWQVQLTPVAYKLSLIHISRSGDLTGSVSRIHSAVTGSVICFVSCANIITAGCLFIKEPQI